MVWEKRLISPLSPTRGGRLEQSPGGNDPAGKLKNTMKTNKVLWFSRHTPTAEQIQDINNKSALALGREDLILVVDAEATRMASVAIGTDLELEKVIAFLKSQKGNYIAICGVFAVPVQAVLAETMAAFCMHFCGYHPQPGGGEFQDVIPCYAAWNFTRSSEGGKPTFQHLKFCLVGQI